MASKLGPDEFLKQTKYMNTEPCGEGEPGDVGFSCVGKSCDDCPYDETCPLISKED